MAKLSTTVIALFCLFTLTIAGDSTESDESITQISLPRSEAAALRLPSDPVNTETESNTAVVASSVPLTKIRFRPVNRRFRVKSIHPCRHHFKVHYGNDMRANGEIPYGNDMLVSTAGEKSEFQEPVVLVDGRRIPMHHLHHHHDVVDSDSDSDSDDEDDDRLKKFVLRRSEYKLKKHLRSQNGNKKGGLMKRVRKFLDHFF